MNTTEIDDFLDFINLECLEGYAADLDGVLLNRDKAKTKLHKLLVEARTQELKRLVRESGWRLSDSHLEIEMKVVRDRIKSLKGRKDK